jgi:hypothetical protein
MTRDRTRQVVTILTFVVTLTINALANILPINGLLTAEISDRFKVFVTPANYVFGIWGLIYVGQLAFTLDQARPGRAAAAAFRRLGYLPALAAALNSAWLLLWQYEVFALTVPVMVALLVTLIVIHRRLRALDAAGGLDRLARWTTRVGFSVYLGWITVATIVNIAAMLDWAGASPVFTPGDLWAAVVLVVGIAITTAFVVRERDSAYGLVITWAYAGIAVKEAGVTAVVATAVAGAALLALFALANAVGRPIGPARDPLGA